MLNYKEYIFNKIEIDEHGIIIELNTDDFCLEDYISCIDENGEKYNFLVSKIIVNPEEFKTIVTLKETGYWNDFLSRKRDSTVKKILGLKFAKIEDPEKINQIKRSSCYC